mmetsp:Transcript_6212/g.15374  ORF Transcript_6212/g.15374 Transcript_6212/m.15374 type:complete len:227 (+) Transcript_6212:2280-2960(+)
MSFETSQLGLVTLSQVCALLRMSLPPGTSADCSKSNSASNCHKELRKSVVKTKVVSPTGTSTPSRPFSSNLEMTWMISPAITGTLKNFKSFKIWSCRPGRVVARSPASSSSGRPFTIFSTASEICFSSRRESSAISALVLYSRSPTLFSASPSASLIFPAASLILVSRSSTDSTNPSAILSGTTARVPVPGALSGVVLRVLRRGWSIRPRAVKGSRMPIILRSEWF